MLLAPVGQNRPGENQLPGELIVHEYFILPITSVVGLENAP